jgi:hypothetical protein
MICRPTGSRGVANPSRLKTSLDDRHGAWIKNSAAVTQLSLASMRLLITMEETFLAADPPDHNESPDAATRDRWRHAKLLDTWHTLGMRGTGSTDIAVTASLCRSTAPRAGGSAAVDRQENAAKPRTDEV